MHVLAYVYAFIALAAAAPQRIINKNLAQATNDTTAPMSAPIPLVTPATALSPMATAKPIDERPAPVGLSSLLASMPTPTMAAAGAVISSGTSDILSAAGVTTAIPISNSVIPINNSPNQPVAENITALPQPIAPATAAVPVATASPIPVVPDMIPVEPLGVVSLPLVDPFGAMGSPVGPGSLPPITIGELHISLTPAPASKNDEDEEFDLETLSLTTN